MASPAADSAYQVMLREHIRPLLRAEGFQGSTTTWRRQSERGDWAIVNLQRSRQAGPDGIWFTINLAVVCRGCNHDKGSLSLEQLRNRPTNKNRNRPGLAR